MNEKLKKYLLLLLKLAVSGTLLYVVLKQAGAEKVLGLLRNISPAAFAAAVLLFLSALFIGTLRWRLLLPGSFRLGRLYSLTLMGSFFSTFLPGVIGGDAVRIYYLYKDTGKGAQALSSVFLDHYIGFCAMMLIGLAAYPFGMGYMTGSWMEWLLPLIIIGFILASVVVFGLRLGQRISVVAKMHDYFHEYRKRYNVIAKALLLSFMLQLIIMFGLYLIARGLGIRVPFTALLIFIPIITTVSTIPVSIAGIGLREAAAVLLMGTVGVEADSAMAFSLAWFLMVAVGGLAGLFEYLRVKKTVPDIEAS